MIFMVDFSACYVQLGEDIVLCGIVRNVDHE